ncbi:hypothetical protein OJ998_24735 [Solirubrobacter taibaiensis]|nr:hypothetical protein [Solirubrobacter taibaiensis]
MRRALLVLLVLLTPGTAEAATVGREGSELVYRSAPGQEDLVAGEREEDELVLGGIDGADTDLQAGAGCTLDRGIVSCALDGLTAVRVLGGDGDDLIAIYDPRIPVVVDLGPGNDEFDGLAPSVTVDAGDGSDRVSVIASTGTIDLGLGEDHADAQFSKGVGRFAVEGGEGRDTIAVRGTSKTGISLSGGSGDDEIRVQTAPRGAGIDIACGPGNDSTWLRLADRPGDGCAAHVTLPDPRTVSRRLSATLTAPATGSVKFHRGGSLLARGPFSAPAGPLRLRLKTTDAGRRALRRDPDPKLIVTVNTRTGGDTSEISFQSRLK